MNVLRTKPNSAYIMDIGYMDFLLIWTILFQYFGYMAFCFMDFSLICTILAGTNVSIYPELGVPMINGVADDFF